MCRITKRGLAMTLHLSMTRKRMREEDRHIAFVPRESKIRTLDSDKLERSSGYGTTFLGFL